MKPEQASRPTIAIDDSEEAAALDPTKPKDSRSASPPPTTSLPRSRSLRPPPFKIVLRSALVVSGWRDVMPGPDLAPVLPL
jgi:hypothetical protein